MYLVLPRFVFLDLPRNRTCIIKWHAFLLSPVQQRPSTKGNSKQWPYTAENTRISTDILWRVFHIFMGPILCTFLSIKRQNSEVWAHMWPRSSLFNLEIQTCAEPVLNSYFCVKVEEYWGVSARMQLLLWWWVWATELICGCERGEGTDLSSCAGFKYVQDGPKNLAQFFRTP